MFDKIVIRKDLKNVNYVNNFRNYVTFNDFKVFIFA